MKKILIAIAIAATSLTFTSCQKEDIKPDCNCTTIDSVIIISQTMSVPTDTTFTTFKDGLAHFVYLKRRNLCNKSEVFYQEYFVCKDFYVNFWNLKEEDFVADSIQAFNFKPGDVICWAKPDTCYIDRMPVK